MRGEAAARSPLRDARPGPARWAGAALAGLLVLAVGVVGGVAVERSVLLAAAAVVAVLAVRGGGEQVPWPPPPARRTRPGWHGVATTLRQVEGARTDTGDRAALRARLARLERDGPHAAAAAVRTAVPGTAARTNRPGPPTRTAPTPRSPS